MQEHKLCVLVFRDISIVTRKTKIVASDTFSWLNYYKKCFCGLGGRPDLVESLIRAIWIWLSRINQQERNGRQKKTSGYCSFVPTFEL